MSEYLSYPVVFKQNIAWGDMDAFGHVNNVAYYRYIESARIHYLEQLNIFSEDIYTVVASNQCKYLKPVFYPDILKIFVRIEELRNSGFRMSYKLWSETQQEFVADADAVIVCVGRDNMKKTNIPKNIKEIIQKLEMEVNHILD